MLGVVIYWSILRLSQESTEFKVSLHYIMESYLKRKKEKRKERTERPV